MVWPLGICGAYKISDMVNFNARGECYRDEEGFTTGVSQTLFEATLGLTLTPFPGMRSARALKGSPGSAIRLFHTWVFQWTGPNTANSPRSGWMRILIFDGKLLVAGCWLLVKARRAVDYQLATINFYNFLLNSAPASRWGAGRV